MGHPAGTILNTGYIESSEGTFKLWKQGMSPSVLRAIQTVGKEKAAVFEKLGGYTDYCSFDHLKETIANPIFQEAWGPIGMKFRYITEDVPNGMVSLASIGEMIGVPTPVCNALITLASMINETDYRAEGRTVEKLGISGLTVEQLNRYLDVGKV